jgi:hypothetical protein
MKTGLWLNDWLCTISLDFSQKCECIYALLPPSHIIEWASECITTLKPSKLWLIMLKESQHDYLVITDSEAQND